MKKIILNFVLQAALLFGLVGYTVSQETETTYFQRIAMEGVEMYGLVTYSPINQLDDMTPGLYKFGFGEQFKPDDNGVLFSRYIAGGGVYHNGKIYCNIYSDEARLPEEKPVWTILDAETYEVLYEKELPDNCQSTTTSLAYDITNNKIYGIVVDYSSSHLVEIDPETGDMTRIGDDFDSSLKFRTLVSDNNGMLYSAVIDKSDSGLYLYRIRKTDGKAVELKPITGKNLLGPDDYLANSNTEQAMFMNRATGKAYWIFESSSMVLDGNYTPIAEINLLNGEATLVAYLSRSYQVSGAWLKEPNTGVPGIITDFEFVTPEEGSASGYLQFRLPENDYYGNPFASPDLKVLVVEGDKVLVDTTAPAGSLFQSEELSLPNDNHIVLITLSNEAGDGPTVQRTFYAGYDLPAAPTNIELSYDGLTTTLTWDAPTIGVNGAIIDKDNIRYRVIKYTGYYQGTNEVVAEDLKECIFVETHPSDMLYYIYCVVATYNGEVGGFGYSNDLVLGSPLDPPYGGMFTGPNDMFNNYTLIDSNGDGYCWNFDTNIRSAIYIYNQTQAADDWLIAPPINYKEGVEYTLSFKAYSSMTDYPESMEVTFGKGRTPEEQTLQLLDIPEVPGVDDENPVTEYSVPIKVEEDGVYYYAFHVTSSKLRECLRVFDIRLDLQTGIETVEDDGNNLVITTGKNSMNIKNPDGQIVFIYNSNGVLIDSSSDAVFERSLYPGIYLVRSNGSAQKIIVR